MSTTEKPQKATQRPDGRFSLGIFAATLIVLALLLGGLLIGLALAGLGSFLARVQAGHHGKQISHRLRRATDEVVDTELVEPLRTETCRWAQLAQILNRITSTDIS